MSLSQDEITLIFRDKRRELKIFENNLYFSRLLTVNYSNYWVIKNETGPEIYKKSTILAIEILPTRVDYFSQVS